MTDLLSDPPSARRGTKAFLVLAPLLLVGAVLAIDAAHGVPLAAWSAARPSLERFIDGRFARAVDEHFEAESQAMRLVRPYWNELMLAAFLETPSKVAVGHDGWLFYTGGLQEDDDRRAPSPFATLDSLVRWLPPETPIVVLVMPSKWRLYEEKLRGAPPLEWVRADSALARQELQARGFIAPDVLAILEDEKQLDSEALLYPPNDTHLSQYGFVRLVERLLPAALGLDVETVRARLLELEVDAESSFYGELERILELRPESRVARAYSYSGPAYSAPLVSDRPAEILVVGDSFVMYYDRLFARLVQHASGSTVDTRLVQPLAAKRYGFAKEIMLEYGERPPRLVLAIYSERRF